jgi:hypothetical protein
MNFVVYQTDQGGWRWYDKDEANGFLPIGIQSFGPFEIEALARKDCYMYHNVLDITHEVYPNGGRGALPRDGVPA